MKFVKVLSDESRTVLIPLAEIKKFEVESLNEEGENFEKEGGLLLARQVKIHTAYEVFILKPAKMNLTEARFKEVDKKADYDNGDDIFELLEKDKRFCAAQKVVAEEIEKVEQEFIKFLESEAKVFDLAKIQDEFRKIKI